MGLHTISEEAEIVSEAFVDFPRPRLKHGSEDFLLPTGKRLKNKLGISRCVLTGMGYQLLAEDGLEKSGVEIELFGGEETEK